jgi:hypothetical protein
VVVSGTGNQDAARFGDSFQTGGDVDAIAVAIPALNHDIAQINPDTQHDMAIFGEISIRRSHSAL